MTWWHAAVVLAAMLSPAGAWISIPSVTNCCGNVLGGTCADNQPGTPCCGVGKCNSYCCGCDGGCRKTSHPTPPPFGHGIPKHLQHTPLKEWPMIMAHDAGTGYAATDTCHIRTQKNNWAVTQTRSPQAFYDQLECGARALDVRPYLQAEDNLVLHHGTVWFGKKLEDALRDVVRWVNKNENSLVVVILSHCGGSDDQLSRKCVHRAHKVAKGLGLKWFGHTEIEVSNLADALAKGRLKEGGGSVVVVWGNAVQSNYDSSIACYGNVKHHLAAFQNKEELDPTAYDELEALTGEPVYRTDGEVDRRMQEEVVDDGDQATETLSGGNGAPSRALGEKPMCHGSKGARRAAFDRMWEYLDRVVHRGYRQHGKLWNAQAHWQYSVEAVAEGVMHRSCILADERSSGINEWMARKIESGAFEHLNLIGMDNVCDSGPDVVKAISHWINKTKLAEKKFSLPADAQRFAHPPRGARRLYELAVGGSAAAVATLVVALGFAGRRGRTLWYQPARQAEEDSGREQMLHTEEAPKHGQET